ncbi:hypothetical protein DFH27DRAFT_600090 [Peziza echinospora]|nr:hypothetical protein DFH27DRAFT_600090 [Peziza echinospora]
MALKQLSFPRDHPRYLYQLRYRISTSTNPALFSCQTRLQICTLNITTSQYIAHSSASASFLLNNRNIIIIITSAHLISQSHNLEEDEIDGKSLAVYAYSIPGPPYMYLLLESRAEYQYRTSKQRSNILKLILDLLFSTQITVVSLSDPRLDSSSRQASKAS